MGTGQPQMHGISAAYKQQHAIHGMTESCVGFQADAWDYRQMHNMAMHWTACRHARNFSQTHGKADALDNWQMHQIIGMHGLPATGMGIQAGAGGMRQIQEISEPQRCNRSRPGPDHYADAANIPSSSSFPQPLRGAASQKRTALCQGLGLWGMMI